MSAETRATAPAKPSPTYRLDLPERQGEPEEGEPWGYSGAQWSSAGAAAVLALGFVLLGAGDLDLGPVESRLGMAAGEHFGPFGQVYGGWEPALWPGRLAPSLAWATAEGGTPTGAAVRWPAALAGVMIGLILARRAAALVSVRAGLLVALAWFGSVGVIDRSAGTGLDQLTGLGVVAALDRVLGRGSDRVAGLWLAWALLAGGWPPVALVVLAVVLLGRPGSGLSAGLLVPPALAFAAWSVWAWRLAPAEVWGAALALPLTGSPAWLLAVGVAALALPWSPLAAVAASPSVREGLPAAGRGYLAGWAQAGAACLLAGTVIPGLAPAAGAPALAALALAAALACDRVWAGAGSPRARRTFFAAGSVVVGLWAVIAVAGGSYLAAAVSYYRPLAVTLVILTAPLALLTGVAVARGRARGLVVAVALVACSLKAAHWGYYVPEWNYRRGQGPWGRAVAQWVPPRWPVYTTHAWNADFGFALGRPVRQLASARHLGYAPGPVRFVLLLDSEYANWPEQAPPLIRVAGFQDEYGGGRVLARTAGPLPWSRAAAGSDSR